MIFELTLFVSFLVFSLRTQNYLSSPDDTEPAVIVAATFDRSSTTLDPTTSLRLGHANDMARWRAAFAQPRQFLAQKTSHREWNAPYHPDDATRDILLPLQYIVPAPPIQAALRSNSTMTAPAPAAAQAPPVKHRTTTTTTTTTKPPPTVATTTTAAKFFGTRASASQKEEDGKENTGNSMTTTKQPKTHFTKTAAATKMIGNADDFIGDLDDDDDDEMDVAVDNVIDIPPPRATKKRHHRINNHDNDDDDVTMTIPDNNDAKVKTTGVVHGAMDAFVTATTTAPALHPRRVKVMTTQTVRDEHGYLVSRQVEEWRDISSNDAAAQASLSLVSKASRPSQPTTSKTTGAAATSKSKKSSTAPNAMKQGSLKGFFTKK